MQEVVKLQDKIREEGEGGREMAILFPMFAAARGLGFMDVH